MLMFPVRSRANGAGTPPRPSRTKTEHAAWQPLLSVVIPALNAAATLPATLAALGDAPAEVVVVDGGSTDATVPVAAALGARVLSAPRGRGGQIAAGVAAARGDWLLLLHADTRLAPGWAAAAAGVHGATGPGAGRRISALRSTRRSARPPAGTAGGVALPPAGACPMATRGC